MNDYWVVYLPVALYAVLAVSTFISCELNGHDFLSAMQSGAVVKKEEP